MRRCARPRSVPLAFFSSLGQVFIDIRQLCEQKGRGPYDPFQVGFLRLEQTADRIAMLHLAAILKVPVLSLAFEPQDTETIGTRQLRVRSRECLMEGDERFFGAFFVPRAHLPLFLLRGQSDRRHSADL